MDISRIPVTAISKVRGIGVADIANTSTVVRSFFRDSFCSTPNRCSSSTTTNPRSLKRTSLERIRWVPTTTSRVPASMAAKISLLSFAVLNRDKPAT